MLAKTVLVLSTLTHDLPAHHEHMIDAAQIMAIQKLARLFPNINFVTEIRYRFNVKFLRFTPMENFIMRHQTELVSRQESAILVEYNRKFTHWANFCYLFL